jgi:CBS domain-containing protein
MTKKIRIQADQIMQTKVAKLSPSDSIESAIALLEGMRIGGAPVVDSAGQPIGVLSLSDIAQSAHVRAGGIEVDRSDSGRASREDDGEDPDAEQEADIFMKEGFSPALQGAECVGDWMNADFVSVAPGTDLKAVCQLMVEHHVHRVFVVEHHKLRGVVTSFDVVRCVAEDD